MILLVLLAISNIKNKDASDKIKSVEKNNADLIKQNHGFQAKIDLLSATREISLILNEDVEFEIILTKSMEIITQLSSSYGETDAVTVFLKSGRDDKLIPVAKREKGVTYFEKELNRQNVNNKNVKESFEHQRLFLSVTGDEFDFSLPLVADREAVGVVKVKTILEGDAEERTRKVGQIQINLMEFAKIISLAIKTPTLYSRTITDSLTGLFSKRHFFAQIQTYFELSRRHKTPFSLLMIDIDHFKSVNDTYGHPVGDLVLREITKLIEKNLRKTSSAYRYGGEEIAIILPNTDLKGAIQAAERVRKKVESYRIIIQEGSKIEVTISLGVSEYNDHMEDVAHLISRADKSLYQAKQTGRNKVCSI
ncbi:MAG: GGDEF domain-containing protein [Planctomycetes bacterium]|nr:GGDEF domain-containing protein [Planctomycetota bacterium]